MMQGLVEEAGQVIKGYAEVVIPKGTLSSIEEIEPGNGAILQKGLKKVRTPHT